MLSPGAYTLVLLAYLLPLPLQAETIAVSDFPTTGLASWSEKSFSGQTQYTIVKYKGDQVLLADSKNSASALYKKIRIDLEKTPCLNWDWLVTRHLGAINERHTQGDDYPARVYVVIDGGVFFWKTRALNYVWSNNQPVGSTWSNAYTDSARMIALQSGSAHLGRWRTEKRNIRADLRQQFGEDLRYIDGIAVMTDTDNSHGQARSYYRKLFFSGE